MEPDKDSGHRKQEKKARWRHERPFVVELATIIFSCKCSKRDCWLFICAHCSNLSGRQTSSGGKGHLTLDKWTRTDVFMANQKTKTHGLGTAIARTKPFSSTFCVSLSSYCCQCRLHEHVGKGELGISGDTGIMRFIFWTDDKDTKKTTTKR